MVGVIPHVDPVLKCVLVVWRGRDLNDANGERIGRLEEVYFDVDTDEPQFGTVKEGWLGRHLTFVPLVGAELYGLRSTIWRRPP